MERVSRSGLVSSRFVGRCYTINIARLITPEKRKCFVRVLVRQNGIVWSSLRTRTATRMNVDAGIRGCVAGAPAIFTKRHFVPRLHSPLREVAPSGSWTSIAQDTHRMDAPSHRQHVRMSGFAPPDVGNRYRQEFAGLVLTQPSVAIFLVPVKNLIPIDRVPSAYP